MPEVYGQISIEEVIVTICAIIVLVVAIGSFFSFFYAVYLFLFSKDKDAKNTKGQATIRYMIIGVLLTVLFLAVLPFALKGVNIELKNYSTSTIFARVGEIIQKTFQVGSAIKNSNIEDQYRGNPYTEPTTTSASPYQL